MQFQYVFLQQKSIKGYIHYEKLCNYVETVFCCCFLYKKYVFSLTTLENTMKQLSCHSSPGREAINWKFMVATILID